MILGNRERIKKKKKRYRTEKLKLNETELIYFYRTS